MKITITKPFPAIDLEAMKIEQVRDFANCQWKYTVDLTDGDIMEAENEMELQGRKLQELPEAGHRASDIIANLFQVVVAIEDAYDRKKRAKEQADKGLCSETPKTP